MKLINKLFDSLLFTLFFGVLVILFIVPPIMMIIYKIFIFLGSLYIDYLQLFGFELPDDTH